MKLSQPQTSLRTIYHSRIIRWCALVGLVCFLLLFVLVCLFVCLFCFLVGLKMQAAYDTVRGSLVRDNVEVRVRTGDYRSFNSQCL